MTFFWFSACTLAVDALPSADSAATRWMLIDGELRCASAGGGGRGVAAAATARATGAGERRRGASASATTGKTAFIDAHPFQRKYETAPKYTDKLGRRVDLSARRRRA